MSHERYGARILSLFVVYVFFLFAFFLTSSVAQAASEFATDYQVHYAISESGTTKVRQEITLTNRLSGLFATEYSVTVGYNDIANVRAFDQLGPIKPQLRKRGNGLEITLEFNEQVIGFENKLFFILEYETNSIATKNGRIWEVTIPGIEKTEDITSYTVSYTVPDSFGSLAYQVPVPDKNETWGLATMTREGISAAYGDVQHFRLDLNYFLENSSLAKRTKTITLPPETAFQSVAITNISPQPQNVFTDSDGNWLAEYSLDSGESLDIVASLQIETAIKPNHSFARPLSNSEREKYLAPQPFWEADFARIKEKALALQTPEAIYTYVVENLTYDYSRVTDDIERLGALNVFAKPESAICMEFTDLFVALARAAGIPARMIQGYAYTTDTNLRPLSVVRDVLHAWPEYYDEQRELWIPVDPTWGNTTGGVDYFSKLDFNHVTFAILGVDSTKPLPAGGFRKIGRGRDIAITFLDELSAQPAPTATISFDLPQTISFGLPKKGTIAVVNTGSTPYYVQSLSLTGDSISIQHDSLVMPFIVPPFGIIHIPLTVSSSSLQSKGARLYVNLDDTVYEHRFVSQSSAGGFFSWALRFWTAGFILFLFMGIKTYQDQKRSR